RAGVDFHLEISRRLASCSVLVALIGPTWLTTTDQSRSRRLDDPDDLVRLEIAVALEKDLHVVPVLVDRETIPNRDQLPAPLHAISRRNAITVANDRFPADIERLVAKIKQTLNPIDSLSKAWDSESHENSDPKRRLAALDFIVENETNDDG